MVVQPVRAHLERLRDLAAQLNTHSDEANHLVAAVETFLSDVCNGGVQGSISIEGHADEYGPHWERVLHYGRFTDGKYRICIVYKDFDDLGPNNNPAEQWTAWANCPRDIRLAAYDQLPALLVKLIEELEARIAKLRASTESIETVLEFAALTKNGGKR
jgi:hypothetical protein